MKNNILLMGLSIALLCCTFNAGAQTNTVHQYAIQSNFAPLKRSVINKSIFALNIDTSINYDPGKYRKFKKMRTKGQVLTGVGAGLIVTGALLIAQGNRINNAHNNNDYLGFGYGDENILAGALCVVFGGLSTGGGITMWAIGNNKMKKYGGGEVRLKATGHGLGLAYKF